MGGNNGQERVRVDLVAVVRVSEEQGENARDVNLNDEGRAAAHVIQRRLHLEGGHRETGPGGAGNAQGGLTACAGVIPSAAVRTTSAPRGVRAAADAACAVEVTCSSAA